jgi:hypothetical protein
VAFKKAGGLVVALNKCLNLFLLGRWLGWRLVGLLRQQDGVDVGQDTALRDGHAGEKLVQLFVVSDGELQVARYDSGLLVVAGSVSGQLENLSAQVLEHSGQVDRRAGTDTSCVVSLAQQSVNTTDRELKTGSG